MRVVHWKSSAGKYVFGLLVGVAAFTIACGESDSDDGEDNDTGGSSAGGTSGAGGTGGATCDQYCERAQACEMGATCAEDCRLSESAFASYGCRDEFRRALACGLNYDDICNLPETVCAAEIEALTVCANGGECDESEMAPATGSCTAECERQHACPGASPVNCATSCAEWSMLVATAGCTDWYQSALGCLGTCMNPCALSSSDCIVTVGNYESCIFGFCEENPSWPICSGTVP